jgi:hypothetical protein
MKLLFYNILIIGIFYLCQVDSQDFGALRSSDIWIKDAQTVLLLFLFPATSITITPTITS